MQYQIEPITLADIESVVRVLLEAFSSNQIDYEGSSNDDFGEYLAYMGAHCADTGLGYVARSVDTQEVIGAVLCADLQESFQSAEFHAEAETDPMFSLLRRLNGLYFESFEIAARDYLNIKFIGVDERYAGQGIAVALLEAALAQGKHQSFVSAHTESAGSLSQRVFSKLGFEAVAEVKYAEFFFEGKTPFQSSPRHQSIRLMIKTL